MEQESANRICTTLFPIRLDDEVTKVESRLARRLAKDAAHWRFPADGKDHDAYQKAFNRLMRDLKADEKKAVKGK